MNTTTLDPSFLQAVVLVTAFKPEPMRRAQAALLYMGLRGGEFTAADLPGEITNGSKHLAGAATGALVALGLLTVARRMKSPDPRAKGRKLDVLECREPRRAAIWLLKNGFKPRPMEEAKPQMEMAFPLAATA
jgi:hypothetical protein